MADSLKSRVYRPRTRLGHTWKTIHKSELARVIADTCSAMELNWEGMQGQDRISIHNRRIVIWVVKKVTWAGNITIAEAMGRDHTTPGYAIDVLQKMMQEDKALRLKVAAILRPVWRKHRARYRRPKVALVKRHHFKPKKNENLSAYERLSLARLPASKVAWYGRDEAGTSARFFARQNARAIAHMRKALAQERRERGG